ncbi:MAG TPA: hypothetical protein VMU97_01645 [Candidatus Dormibacteraeota bacterium]|nr:hypothetical protein [Candidatus Dormibacteraeota bacterium]
MGKLVLVGGFPEDNRQADAQAKHAVDILHDRGLLRPYKTIGIRPMIPATQTTEPVSLIRTADALRQSLLEGYGILPIVDEDPIRCGTPASCCGPKETTRALDGALDKFELQTGQHDSRYAQHLSLGFVAVVDAGYARRTLESFRVTDLDRGVVARLDSVGEHPRDNDWTVY